MLDLVASQAYEQGLTLMSLGRNRIIMQSFKGAVLTTKPRTYKDEQIKTLVSSLVLILSSYLIDHGICHQWTLET